MRRRSHKKAQKIERSQIITTQNFRVRRTRLPTVRKLSHAILSARSLCARGCDDALLHFEDLRRVYRSAILAVARSAGYVAYGPRGPQLLHDRLLEPRKLDPAGTDAGHFGKRAPDADQFADGDRRQFGVGLSGNDVLFVSVFILRESFLWRRVSWELPACVSFSATDDGSALVFRHTLGEFCDGL